MRPIARSVLQGSSHLRSLRLTARSAGRGWSWSYRGGRRVDIPSCRPCGRRCISGVSVPSHSFSDSTIFALSTAPGRAALAIIRCSGPRCVDIYHALCPHKPLPPPRTATLRTLYRPLVHNDTSNHLPQPATACGGPDVLDPGALVLYFPAPHTVTGEDVLELHVHGGVAVVRAVLASIPTATAAATVTAAGAATKASTSTSTPYAHAAASIRYAEPGEFTRRAFTNARLSLPQIEALSATLSATTTQQHRVAVAASTGAVPLAARYESWRTHLVAARGELEALIDFAEDQHFDEHPAMFLASVAQQVKALRARLQAHIEHAAKGEMLRDGVSVALVGAPNAGKSSLLNAVAGREAAIVHAEPGTTRDVLDIAVDVDGYACRFGDLAGLRSANDAAGPEPAERIGAVEMEGIRRAKARARGAQVVIAVIPIRADGQYALDADVRAVLADIDPTRQRLLVALNKTDLLQDLAAAATLTTRLRNELPPPLRQTPISLISSLPEQQPDGIRTLLAELSTACRDITSPLSLSENASSANDTLDQTMATVTETEQAHAQGQEHGQDWDLGPPSSASLALGASERQRHLLEEAMVQLDAFLATTKTVEHLQSQARGGGKDEAETEQEEEQEVDIVLAAEYLRAAADCLGRVSGRGAAGDVEEVLGVVFERFCVGK